MARDAVERAAVFVLGGIGGLVLASALSAAPDVAVHEHVRTHPRSEQAGDLDQRPRVELAGNTSSPPDSETGTVASATRAGEPSVTAQSDSSRPGEAADLLTPPEGALEAGAYSVEDWDAVVQSNRHHPWGDPANRQQLDEAARMRAMERELPLPLKGARYQDRSFRDGGGFRRLAPGMGGRARAAPLTAARAAAAGHVSAEDREAFRVQLWSLERRRRETEIAIVERENELMNSTVDSLEVVEDAEFWFTLHGSIYVLRAGADAEHARLIRALEALDNEAQHVRQQFHESHR